MTGATTPATSNVSSWSIPAWPAATAPAQVAGRGGGGSGLGGAGGYVELTNPHGISFLASAGIRHHTAAACRTTNAGTSLGTVTRRSLSQTTPVNGTLG